MNFVVQNYYNFFNGPEVVISVVPQAYMHCQVERLMEHVEYEKH